MRFVAVWSDLVMMQTRMSDSSGTITEPLSIVAMVTSFLINLLHLGVLWKALQKHETDLGTSFMFSSVT